MLITGFEPFGEFAVNSSWEAVRRVPDLLDAPDLEEAAVHPLLLPVDHRSAQERLYEVLQDTHPEICLLTGLAAGAELRMERHARKPRELADLEGPERMDGAWPWDEMTAALESVRAAVNLGVRLSEDAGCYVCESTYWALLAFRAAHGWPRSAAFLHVPPLSLEVSAELLAEAVARALRGRLENA